MPEVSPSSGTVERHPLAAVLLALLREQRDGCLTVSRGGITRRLYLRGGMIVYGSSTKRADRLGEILIAQGKLSREDHRKYWEESRAGNRKLGITLVVNGIISLSDLYQAVTAQVVTILDRLQKWRTGDFAFEEGRQPAPGTVLLRIPLALYLRTGRRKRPVREGGRVESPALASGPAVPGGSAPLLAITEEELGAGAAISPEEARRLESVGEVSFLVQELRRRVGKDPRALLGVPADAGRDAVQTAYERIAAVLGPDGLPQGCTPELAREAREIFREVTAAFQATAGDQLRRQQQVAPPPPQRVLPTKEADPSRHLFTQGKDWIAKRNYWQAADALRQAVRLKPGDATYRQYLGLALVQIKRLHEAEEHLVEAVRLEPDNAATFVNLGRVYRAGRLYGKARHSFRQALRVDPRNKQARDELSDLPEEPPPAQKDEGGILKKFFGK